MARALIFAATLLVSVVARAQPHALAGTTFEGRTFPAHWARAPLDDLARAAARVDIAWQDFGVRGRGATVCVIDTGVDLAHRDFRDAADHTRVDWLLDLDRAPRGSEPALEARFGGAVFRGDELDAMIAASDPTLPTDWHGHGTTVASAAVGDDAPPGVDTPGLLAGVAPAARLVVVRALRRGTPGFRDDDIVRGATFCATVADPAHAVALLSLGGHDGAHDGTSAVEVALAELVHHGLTIVVASGNDGGRAMHAATRVAEGASAHLSLQIPAPEGTTDASVVVTVRGTRDVTIIAPDGASAHVDRSVSTSFGTLSAVTRDDVVDVMVVGDAGHPLRGGIFTIAARGPAHVDAWIVSVDLGTAPFSATFTGAGAVIGEEVTMPATCESVIAVGSSVSRPALVTTDGSPTLTLDADAEGRALFSSRGPSASGALRPDVLAPGGWIVAARSRAVDPTDPEALVHGRISDWSRLSQPDDRIAIAGTSLSAAIVAGAMALAAELAPLDPIRDREALAASAMRADGAAFTRARGFGTIDVAAFLDARHTPSSVATSGALSASRPFSTPGASDLALALVTTTPSDGWVDFLRDGELVASAPLRAGIARAPVAIGRATSGSIVTWTARIDGRDIATTATPIRWNDDGALAIAGGGASCAVGHTRSGVVPIALLLLGCWARASRRDRRSELLRVGALGRVRRR